MNLMDSDRAIALNARLTTLRLELEPQTGDHAEALFGLMQDESIYQWISDAPPKNLERMRQRWQMLESRLSPEQNQAWLNWVVRRTSDGKYVGRLDAAITAENVAANVGYVFFSEFWGQGYASEAVKALTDHFAKMGIHKMIATVTIGNERSYRVLEKSGFTRTRILPDHDTIRGIKYDDVEFIRTVTT